VTVVANDQRRAGGSAGSSASGPAAALLAGAPEGSGEPQGGAPVDQGPLSCPTFVGREAESARLAAARDRAAAGVPAVVLVGGEAGVGKSRLVGELVAGSRAVGATVLAGGCVELGGEGLPFAPVVAALRELAGGLGDAELATLVPEPARSELARLVPELGPAAGMAGSGTPPAPAPAGGPQEGTPAGPTPGEPGSAQRRLFGLLLDLLQRLAARRPTVLVVEDLHWADRSTRDLLAYLVRNLEHGRLLLVLTYRGEELHRRHPLRPLLAELERDRRVERLELRRFDLGEVTAQLTGILGVAPAARLVERVHARSGGNALFVEELAAATPAGWAAAAGGAPAAPAAFGGLREVLLDRIEPLPEPAREVLRVVALAGGRVGHELLAEAAGLPAAELQAGVRAAAAAGVLLVDAHLGYGLRHALVKEAIDDALLRGERCRLHARLAAALGRAGAGRPGGDPALAAELAWHWYAAHDLARALPAAVGAGLAAERCRAFAEAQHHFERALELWELVPAAREGLDRVELLARAAEAAANAGGAERAISLVRGALAEVDPARDRRAGPLARRLAGYQRVAGRPGA
jgi:predicted ATPase